MALTADGSCFPAFAERKLGGWGCLLLWGGEKWGWQGLLPQLLCSQQQWEMQTQIPRIFLSGFTMSPQLPKSIPTLSVCPWVGRLQFQLCYREPLSWVSTQPFDEVGFLLVQAPDLKSG